MTRQFALRIALWLAVMLCAAFIVARARYTADLSAFLPRAPSARQALLVDQLREVCSGLPVPGEPGFASTLEDDNQAAVGFSLASDAAVLVVV